MPMMKDNKSDFRRFCQTMWAMAKDEIVFWALAAGVVAISVAAARETKQRQDYESVKSVPEMLAPSAQQQR